MFLDETVHFNLMEVNAIKLYAKYIAGFENENVIEARAMKEFVLHTWYQRRCVGYTRP